MKANFETSLKLVQSLKNHSFYSYSVSEITILETHISWVILTGPLHCQLRDTARKLLSFNYHVIVDATFLKRRYRDLFRRLADEQKVPFLILDVQSSLRTLKDRISHRLEQRADASEATLSVLLQQQREKEPLGEDEQKVTITINSEKPLDPRIIFQDLLKSKC